MRRLNQPLGGYETPRAHFFCLAKHPPLQCFKFLLCTETCESGIAVREWYPDNNRYPLSGLSVPLSVTIIRSKFSDNPDNIIFIIQVVFLPFHDLLGSFQWWDESVEWLHVFFFCKSAPFSYFQGGFFVKHPGGVHLEISVNNAVRCSFSVNHRKEGGLIASFAYNMG